MFSPGSKPNILCLTVHITAQTRVSVLRESVFASRNFLDPTAPSPSAPTSAGKMLGGGSAKRTRLAGINVSVKKDLLAMIAL